MNPIHSIHSKDADACCRWLCESAGVRTNRDNREIADALDALPYRGEALPLGLFPGKAGSIR